MTCIGWHATPTCHHWHGDMHGCDLPAHHTGPHQCACGTEITADDLRRHYGVPTNATRRRGVTQRPILLDLFCGAGGAATGYHRAGFDVIGVDIEPQPNYPFLFIQGDWRRTLWKLSYAHDIAAIHASPPCQRYSDLARRNGNADDWPDLVDAVRDAIAEFPYVIENVEGAPLRDPVTLCGTMFSGLRVIRHRLFETNWQLWHPGEHPPHPLVFTHDKRKKHYGKLDQDTAFVQVTGGGNATLANKLDAMGTPWMRSHHEVNESIPPAYTEWIGTQLMQHVRSAA